MWILVLFGGLPLLAQAPGRYALEARQDGFQLYRRLNSHLISVSRAASQSLNARRCSSAVRPSIFPTGQILICR